VALTNLLPLGRPAVAYLFPELDPTRVGATLSNTADSVQRDSTFVFQFWPTQIQDNYEVEYATKPIPGGSHPLYQWIGGSGRVISFEAVFTSEIEDDFAFNGLTALTPSSRYSVNVAGAIAALRSYQYPTYREGSEIGIVEPPKRLHLVLPKTNIGGDRDDILCFLKSCRVTIESSFPSGAIRVATVALEFIETVQKSTGDPGVSRVQFIGTSSFKKASQDYKYRAA
jgi:hypothetical protein